MSFVFISYRRSDSAATARAIREALVKELGDRNVYLDVSSNKLGEDYPEQLNKQLMRADFVLVLIGRTWLTAGIEHGKRRIDLEDDWVRVEVASALAKPQTRVVPVLIDDTEMPTASALPVALASLARRQFTKLHHESWEADIQTLLAMFEPTDLVEKPARQIRKYRIEEYLLLFDRPAFKYPCIFEAGLKHLLEALDDISAAIATGSLYSRKGTLLARITPRIAFKSIETRRVLGEIASLIGQIRRLVNELRALLADAEGKEVLPFEDDTIDDMEYYLINLIRAGVSHSYIGNAFDLMDRIDTARNQIINKVNKLLENIDSPPIQPIPMSSELLKTSAEMDAEVGGPAYRWDEFYLRWHEPLREFLENGKISPK